MSADLDALLISLYVLVDDLLPARRRRLGRPVRISARLLRPDRKGERPRFGTLGGIRHWIESTFDTLKDQLSLERHSGRTLTGLVSRIARRLLALTAAILHNWQTGNPGRRLTAYDH